MTTRKEEAEPVAVVIDPTVMSAESAPAAAVEVNPYSAQPVVQVEPEWDEPELNPMKRLSIAEDPDGSKNAAALAAAIARHQDKST